MLITKQEKQVKVIDSTEMDFPGYPKFWVGRLVYHWDILNPLQVFVAYRDEDPIKFIITGDNRDELIERAKRGIQDKLEELKGNAS